METESERQKQKETNREMVRNRETVRQTQIDIKTDRGKERDC